MENQKNDEQKTTLSEIGEPDQTAPQKKPESASEQLRRYMTEEERREWSGLSEWHDPLDKEKPETNPNDGKFALASLLCGIFAVLLACVHISSLLFGIAAIVCGIIAKKRNESASGMIKAGILLGCICFGIALCLEIFHIMGKLFPPESVNIIPEDLASEIK